MGRPVTHIAVRGGRAARRRPRRRGVTARGGNALIEMAIVLPMLSFIALGLAEFGQYFYVQSAIESATRDALRFAIPATAQQGDPAAAATATLAAAGITFNASWMVMLDLNTFTLVTDCSAVPAGHPILAQTIVTYATLPNAYRPLSRFCGVGIGSGKAIVCQCTMVKE